VETTIQQHSQRTVRFEMKLTPDEKRQITLLSQREGKPAKKVIMRLVQQALRQIKPTTLSAKDIMKLPPKERNNILTQQFQAAEKLYKDNPELIVPDIDAPIDY
jgi:hypothetical protein